MVEEAGWTSEKLARSMVCLKRYDKIMLSSLDKVSYIIYVIVMLDNTFY